MMILQTKTLIDVKFFSNVHAQLGFLVPAFADSNFGKCQIFCVTKNMTDIVGMTYNNDYGPSEVCALLLGFAGTT